MIQASYFLNTLQSLGADFFTGVPDSLLRPFCDELMLQFGICDRHIVAANEGAAVGLAAGHYLASGKLGVVYMQNSGIGNAVNPLCSLLHEDVCAIPAILVIGWRGEPGVKDEPQHIFQGKVTLPLLDTLSIPYGVLSSATDENELAALAAGLKTHLDACRPVAFVVQKGALSNDRKFSYPSAGTLTRERVLELFTSHTDPRGVYVCTTGKLSREMFELREQKGEGHERDFLTVGAMGHCLMIALGIALAQPQKAVYCLDGDGAMLMHMGSLAVLGAHHPKNLVHLVVNNGAHETVGGMCAVSSGLKLYEVARSLGYAHAFRAADEHELVLILQKVRALHGPVFIEALCNLSSRSDLGRPTVTPQENKHRLMNYLGAKP